MPLALKSPKAHALARELAAATGEDMETVVERALEERLARLQCEQPARRDDREEIEAIFDRLAHLPLRDSRSAEDIIGYDRNGLPE